MLFSCYRYAFRFEDVTLSVGYTCYTFFNRLLHAFHEYFDRLFLFVAKCRALCEGDAAYVGDGVTEASRQYS